MPQYSNGSFGAVLDKGTMDAMACGEKAVADIYHMLMESSRHVNTAQTLPLLHGDTTILSALMALPTLQTSVCIASWRSRVVLALMLRPCLHTSLRRQLLAPTSDTLHSVHTNFTCTFAHVDNYLCRHLLKCFLYISTSLHGVQFGVR